ncbi:long-chain fatty acid--CoA ligase [Carboxylicivirga sp. M1479]|uniref:AMP-dependent synthetase/ligase n=1 Tax=Carboxylicivirga sp. M1479 TaxID=2594476 RepID=UPI001177A984|nr:AMP-binding protein [Carboxylicivirga sp. M1479]TRX70292.1 AMP-binding protein [Carboxylicivirga sp. M1479]
MKSLINFFEDSVQAYANNPLMWEKNGNTFQSYSYKQIQKEVYEFSNGLLALGISAGDRVALLSEGRRLWLVSELAILHIGAINVPLSTKLEADTDLIFRLNHSEAETVIVSKNQVQKIRLTAEHLPKLKTIIILDDEVELGEKEIIHKELIDKGGQFKTNNPETLKAEMDKVGPNTIANICYTSGTTADPKGIMLTHRNYTANVEQAFSYINVPQHYKTLVVLPWDHAFAHTASLYSFMHKGASIASVQIGRNQHETLKNFVTNMQEVKPEILMSVPALAKNFKKNIEKAIEGKGPFAQKLFTKGLDFAYWYNADGYNAGNGLKKLTYPIYALFKTIIFDKIKERFGGNLQYFIGGGALLDIELQRFFYAIGIPMFQGYGLSEASPIISANTPLFHKLGSSGKVVNDIEIKICDTDGKTVKVGDKGEIVIRGENVMKGYWRNEEATQQTIKDGWLYTGDLGYLDDQNYLYVLGRFKSLLIGADGEKYSPEGIEEAVIDHCTFIDQFLLHNNQNPFTSGLIVLNKEKINHWLKHHLKTIESDQTIVEILQLIQTEIEEFKNSSDPELNFPSRWLPSTLVILKDGFTEENKLLNSTMKVVRSKVEAHFEQEIEYLYTPSAKNFFSDTNINNIRSFLR